MTDKALTDLAERVAALEVGAQFTADQNALREFQMEILAKLRGIREALVADGAAHTSSKEIDALRAENEQLRKQNEKNEYRINHLVKNMSAIEYGS